MTEAREGEIRRAVKWNYLGREATGDRPSLVISPDWFNESGNAVIVPLTTPGPNHENWWEPYIASTDSTCLVPGVRTVPVRALGRSVDGLTAHDELEDVISAIERLTNGREEMSGRSCSRGKVWEANLSDMNPKSAQVTVEVLILRYNPSNCMAMSAFVSTRKRKPSPIVAEIRSSNRLQSRSVLLGQLRPVAADLRLQNRIGTVPFPQMETPSNRLRRFLSSSARTAPRA